MSALWRAWRAYRLRWKRRYLLSRAVRKRHQLKPLQDRTAQIEPGQILLFCTLRNEALRLPYFLDHHRALGVDHFLFVDNDSTDGTADLLVGQPDVSLWHSGDSYKASRFGMDWLGWLQLRHGHGHWCLTMDADEILVYPFHDSTGLRGLTAWLDSRGWRGFRTLMIDLYPRGPLRDAAYRPGQDPTETIPWFDADNFTFHPRPELQTLLARGGVRARYFFSSAPERAPTMNKTPLVKWDRRFSYLDSTHSLLPPRMNRTYPEPGIARPTGALLHTKFLNTIVAKSAEEKQRKEHFANSALYDDYYDGLIANPDLWVPTAQRYVGWQQLETLGLLSRGDWSGPERDVDSARQLR
ncbi:glycosyltransferase family 2 protein [Oceaniglobus trochenteri]|uniref:glycosyltransferase family 2 protein n=1 Tax=Oceaniglobus trochenteri TaxID=2763260 RepID=UPI001CFFF223|nr:glycosyltransferase family 2 protein [Oceaniglobus trochenteri]